MTTKQAIRKVLTNTDRFIIGDYNGQKWYCPDAFIATIDNIYEQYKPKKSQDVDAFTDASKQPKMNAIFNRTSDGSYQVATTLDNADVDTQTYLVAGNSETLVNRQYLEFMQALYPTAHFEIDTVYKYSPVKVVVRDHVNGGNKLVALIMPLHR